MLTLGPIRPVLKQALSSTSTSNKMMNKFESPLNMICEERREYDLVLGKAIDTLKKDYPDILTNLPDLSIFHDDVEVVDPSGVTIHGKKNYETSFRVVHSVVSFFYCPESSGLTFRLVYDLARNSIRVSWNAVVIPKAIYGGDRNKLHVDGISVYELDRNSGLITQHRVEHLLLNNTPVHAPKGIFHALTNEVAHGVPVAGGFGFTKTNHGLQPRLSKQNTNFSRKSSRLTMTSTSASTSDSGENFDYDAFQKKNATRKKFGLPPLSEEEFEKVQAEVQRLDMQQRQRQQQAQRAAAAELAQEKEKKRSNFLADMMGDVLTDTCESNFDCERPQVCCDFLVKKVCCDSGMRVLNRLPGKMQPLRVPIPIENGDFPRGGPDGMPGDRKSVV